jgi:hypothetical protein
VQQIWRLLRKTKPLLSPKRRPISKHIKRLGIKINYAVDPDGAGNQE